MNVGVDDCPAAGAHGDFTSQCTKQRLRVGIRNQREKDPQRLRVRRSFHRSIVASVRGKNNGDAISSKTQAAEAPAAAERRGGGESRVNLHACGLSGQCGGFAAPEGAQRLGPAARIP